MQNNPKHKLSVVIPAYNEEKNIPLIFLRLKEAFGGRDDIEVILVNNGSTDKSADVIADEMKSTGAAFFKIVNVPVNQGYGYGILQGLNDAGGDILGWTHADMQTDPMDVLKAFDLYKNADNQKIIVKGERQNRRLLETIFTFGMQVVASLFLKTVLDDINAQPKVFSRPFYESYIKKSAPHDFSLDLYLLYQAKQQKYRILNVPVIFAKRLHGEAKGGGSWKTRIKLIRRTFSYIFELKKKLTSEEN